MYVNVIKYVSFFGIADPIMLIIDFINDKT